MRQFYTAYEHNSIRQLLTVQLQTPDSQPNVIGPLPTAQLHKSDNNMNNLAVVDGQNVKYDNEQYIIGQLATGQL